ncbi:4Fe-4S dicluster domain-containing protein [bacterium]|nr:4Fe-4S dicluster domain-containing protein [bacterium]
MKIKLKIKKQRKVKNMSLNSSLKIDKKILLENLEKTIQKYDLIALKKKGENYLYDYIQKSKEIIFKYHPTVLSPKKFFFPKEEVLFEYTADGEVTPKSETKPTILFGIRPCDVNGIHILNEAFAESKGDPNYLAKKENSLVIGLDCEKLCDENAFCYRVKSQNSTKGADLFLHDLGSEFALTIITDKGKKFAQEYLQTSPGSAQALAKYQATKEKSFSLVAPFRDLDKLPEIFSKNQNHVIWKEKGSKCLSCGSCIMVCPTCYCFDVADEFALNLQKGERLRRWDACMLSSFAEVAGGENFRDKAENRLKHRLNRKFNYLMKKHGQAVCVGCGRCVRACLADINPKLIVKVLTGEQE